MYELLGYSIIVTSGVAIVWQVWRNRQTGTITEAWDQMSEDQARDWEDEHK